MQNLTKAEENTIALLDLCKDIKTQFLNIGDLLNENYEGAFWSLTGWECFKDFVESLGLQSYSWATRLMDISRLVMSQIIDKETALEIGVSKIALLLPLLKKGDLSLIELAKAAPVSDLKYELGHKIKENFNNHSIQCPRCGAEISGAKWVKTI